MLLQKQGYEPATKHRTSVNNVTAREKFRVHVGCHYHYGSKRNLISPFFLVHIVDNIKYSYEYSGLVMGRRWWAGPGLYWAGPAGQAQPINFSDG